MAATLILLALLQGIPIAPQAGGTVSGVVRTVEGKPAANVRVSAMTRQEPLQDTGAIALASLAETDQEGRYTIENVPPGQYYIVAGNIDRPTYYPGTQQMSGARGIQVTPGARISGIDFAVIDASKQLPAIAFRGFGPGPPRLQVNLRLVAEPGSRIPAVSPAGPLAFMFERSSDRTRSSIPSTAASVLLDLLPTGSTTEYRVGMTNLPDGFVVKKMTYGVVDVSSGILALPTVSSQSTALQNAIASILGIVTGDHLTVTIGEISSSISAAGAVGVRVRGMNRPSDTHPVYLSGREGTVFRDGTFEFRNVPAGRHVIAGIDLPGRALGTTLIVGDRDIDNVSLDEIAALPLDIQSPVAPGPAGIALPGSTLRPAVLRGVVLDRVAQQPPQSGQVWINTRNSPSYPLDTEGRFEVPGLLPGAYRIELQVAGYSTVTRELTVGVEDLRLAFQIEK